MDKHMDEARKMNALRAGLLKKENKDGRWANIRTGLLVAIAVMLVMSAVMGTAWAYFTTYARAKGMKTLNLGHQEEIEEHFENWKKTVNLTSKPDSRPAYVRVHAFCAEYELEYENADNWTLDEDGYWWYYNKPLQPGKSLSNNSDNPEDPSDELTVHIKDVPDTGTPGLADDETFSVIIVYESTDVQYDEDGNEKGALDADWSRKVNTNRITTSEGGDD